MNSDILHISDSYTNIVLDKNKKINSIQISKYRLFKDFNLNFYEALNNPLKIIVIAGINGTGKTTLLNIIHKLIKNSIFIPANIESQKLENIDLLLIKLVKRYIFKLNHSPFEAYRKVSNLINEVFVDFDLKISFSSLDEEEKVYFENKNKEKILINQLSTGEKTLLSKVLYLYLLEVKNKVILIDEPELSLHPRWQNRVLSIYEQFAGKNNNQIIIATHSPHIIGSAKPESLRVLHFVDNKVEVFKDFTEGYGLEVNQILTKIMDVDSLRTPSVEKIFVEIKSLIIRNNYKGDKFKNLWNELESYLGKNNIDLKLLEFEIKARDKNV